MSNTKNTTSIVSRVSNLEEQRRKVSTVDYSLRKFTVLWFYVGSHGYHEVMSGNAHAALTEVTRTLSGDFANKCKYQVYEGTPFRGTTYCMKHTTFLSQD